MGSESPHPKEPSSSNPKTDSTTDPEESSSPEARRRRASQRIRNKRGGDEGEEYANPNYRGDSVYVKSDGTAYKKIGVEVRLDQYEALCAARAGAQVKRPDPWGRNASEIVRTLLDEAGFDASYEGP